MTKFEERAEYQSKGRNGYFWPAAVNARGLPTSKSVSIDIEGSRSINGAQAPIRIALTPSDARRLLRAISLAIAEAEAGFCPFCSRGAVVCNLDPCALIAEKLTRDAAKDVAAVFEMSPIGVDGALEANGTVYYFCTTDCCTKFYNKHQHEATLKIGTSPDYDPQTLCDFCEGQL